MKPNHNHSLFYSASSAAGAFCSTSAASGTSSFLSPPSAGAASSSGLSSAASLSCPSSFQTSGTSSSGLSSPCILFPSTDGSGGAYLCLSSGGNATMQMDTNRAYVIRMKPLTSTISTIRAGINVNLNGLMIATATIMIQRQWETYA